MPVSTSRASATATRCAVHVEQEFLRQLAIELERQIFVQNRLPAPGLAVDLHKLKEVLVGEAIHVLEVDVITARHTAQRAAHGTRMVDGALEG